MKKIIHINEDKLRAMISEMINNHLSSSKRAETTLTEELLTCCTYVDNEIRGWRTSRLDEAKGLFPNYNIIMDVICNYVENYINSNNYNETIQGGIKVWTIEMNESIFGENHNNCFFNKLTLTVNMLNVPNHPKFKLRNYMGGKYTTDIEVKDNKINELSVSITAPFQDGNDITEWLKGEILHEFTHAYSDLSTRLKSDKRKEEGKSVENIITSKDYVDTIYNKYIKYNDDKNNVCNRMLGNIFYYLSRTEQNAYSAQMYAELYRFDYDFLRSNPTAAILSKMEVWQEFIKLKEQLDYLSYYSNDKKTAKQIMDAVNDMCYNKKFKTAKDAIRWLDNQRQITQRRAVEKLGRVIKQFIMDNFNANEHINNPMDTLKRLNLY